MKLSRGWKFFITFGIGFLIVLIFLALNSPASFAIAGSAPVAAFIVFYFWTKDDPDPKKEKNESSSKKKR